MTVLPRRSFSAISFPSSSGKVKSGALSLTFMGISPSKSKANARGAASAKMVFQKILYRGSFLVALFACVAFPVTLVSAQEDRPQITPGERKAPRKKDAGPRAVAVLQLALNGKASLVPIAILIGGRFWDATAYKADPIPMALEPGTVYEAEHAGSSLGLFTVNSALHSNAVNVSTPWLGTGGWCPGGASGGSREAEDGAQGGNGARGNRYQRRASAADQGCECAKGGPAGDHACFPSPAGRIRRTRTNQPAPERVEARFACAQLVHAAGQFEVSRLQAQRLQGD